jgi:hypothetical protein
LEIAKESTLRHSPPSSGKRKRAAADDDDDFQRRREEIPSHVDVAHPQYTRQSPYSIASDRIQPNPDPQPFDPKQSRGSSPYQSTPEPSFEWSVEANKKGKFQPSQTQSPARPLPHRTVRLLQFTSTQPGLFDLQNYDPRYPGLLLQPDSRPISQEQLATEIKIIYTRLTRVEFICIHVNRAQAAAAQDTTERLASDHWQAIIAIHRTLLHEHHDFLLASQHPSASPALRRLAAKYSMPARMWKHGIHRVLELLRRRLPGSIDYMLAFIYLAYQMMALLIETVPAFEDTWIEFLGHLARYRMAIEDEDVRDRETWAGVAGSWYTKAAENKPTVGRLYHHLAILARTNALQRLYYYARSLTCVKPFPSARKSILTLLNPILGRGVAAHAHSRPIDTSFIKAHALLFEKTSLQDFEKTKLEFISNLDDHISQVNAKWKEQGVYIAVTNIAAWFDYGVNDNALRQVFLTHLFEHAEDFPTTASEDIHTASPADQQDPMPPKIPEFELSSHIATLSSQPTFINAKSITNETFNLVLRRIGDKNVLPNVNILLASLNAFASSKYVSHLINDIPWTELVAFLNTLARTESRTQSLPQTQSQTEDINALLSSNVFPNDGERRDELPLPEDHLIRGLIWAHQYFPTKWFEREHEVEERYLELPSTVHSRIKRVLRLGYRLSTVSIKIVLPLLGLTNAAWQMDIILSRTAYFLSQ